MKKLLTVLLACLLVMGLAGCSSEGETATGETTYRVGVVQLIEHDALDAATQGFVDVLKEEFGDAIEIDVKTAGGDSANCSTIANGYVSEGVNLIMANATPALQAAAAATNSIPVLGTSVTEYGVALGIDNFGGVTGTNVSGTSDLAPLDEQAQMLVDLIPSAKSVGILYCSNEANSKYQVKVISEELEKAGVKVEAKSFTDSNDIAAITAELCSGCDALYVPTDNQVASYGETINNIASEKKIPIICGEEGTCVKCGVATLTIDYYELGRTTGQMAVKILKGEANVSEMPIEYYTNPVKKYNKEIAANCGVEIPSEYIEIE